MFYWRGQESKVGIVATRLKAAFTGWYTETDFSFLPIYAYSRAADESANQAILLTCAVLKDTLLGQIREHMESLFKVSCDNMM